MGVGNGGAATTSMWTSTSGGDGVSVLTVCEYVKGARPWIRHKPKARGGALLPALVGVGYRWFGPAWCLTGKNGEACTGLGHHIRGSDGHGGRDPEDGGGDSDQHSDEDHDDDDEHPRAGHEEAQKQSKVNPFLPWYSPIG